MNNDDVLNEEWQLESMIVLHDMCYSQYGNGFRNGTISIEQLGLLSDCYEIDPIGQWEKNSGM